MSAQKEVIEVPNLTEERDQPSDSDPQSKPEEESKVS